MERCVLIAMRSMFISVTFDLQYLMFLQGFTFLNIPRSYYGILTRDMLENGVKRAKATLGPPQRLLSPDCAETIYNICASEGLLQDDCSVKLDASKDSITQILSSKIPCSFQEEYDQNKDGIVKTILQSRYVNLYNLLRVSDLTEMYMLPACFALLITHNHNCFGCK